MPAFNFVLLFMGFGHKFSFLLHPHQNRQEICKGKSLAEGSSHMVLVASATERDSLVGICYE